MSTWTNRVVLSTQNPIAASSVNGIYTIYPSGSITAGTPPYPTTVVSGSTFTPTAGNFLVCVMWSWNGLNESFSFSNWTSRQPIKSDVTAPVYVYTKTATGGTSDYADLYTASAGQAAIVEFFEYPAGSSFVSEVSSASNSVASGSSIGTLSGLSGINHIFFAIGQYVLVTPYSSTTTWSTGTKITDYSLPSAGGSNYGFQYSLAYLPDSSLSSVSNAATSSNSGANNSSGIIFAISLMPSSAGSIRPYSTISASGGIAVANNASSSVVSAVSTTGSIGFSKSSNALGANASVIASGGVNKSASASVSVTISNTVKLTILGMSRNDISANISAQGLIKGSGSSSIFTSSITANGTLNGFFKPAAESSIVTVNVSGYVGKRGGSTRPTVASIVASGKVTRINRSSVNGKASINAHGYVRLYRTANVSINAKISPFRVKIAKVTGSFNFSGNAVANVRHKAGGTGSYRYSGSAQGRRYDDATANGTFHFTGSTVGKSTHIASVTGSTHFDGVAYGNSSVIYHPTLSMIFVSENRAHADLTSIIEYEDRISVGASTQVVYEDRVAVKSTIAMVSEILQNTGITTYQFIWNNLPQPVTDIVTPTSTGARSFVTATSRDVGYSLNPKAK